MERLTIYSAALIVVGDLTSTSMMRPTTTPSSCSIFCHLSTHDLQQQRVNSPTYPQGHTLDVFIARNDQPDDMLSIHPLLLSDHPCVVADSTVSYVDQSSCCGEHCMSLRLLKTFVDLSWSPRCLLTSTPRLSLTATVRRGPLC